jgi:hypothetical protein
VEQPFPATVKQHNIVDRLEARLIVGARTQLIVLGPVQASLVEEIAVGNHKKPTPPLAGNEEHLNQNTVVFNKIKFTLGTGCKVGSLTCLSQFVPSVGSLFPRQFK